MENGTKHPVKHHATAASQRKPARPSPTTYAERYRPPENRARSHLIVSVVALIVGGLFVFLTFGMG
jgi:hypothetical protein